MKTKTHRLIPLVVAAMFVTSSPVLAGEDNLEKCYGVAAAGKNECGSKSGNACAAQVKKDNDPQAWITVRKGDCHKIAKGSTTPPK